MTFFNVLFVVLIAVGMGSAQASYSDLSLRQQAKFESYCRPLGCVPAMTWEKKLDSSQQLEYAGGSQAMDTIKLSGLATGLNQIAELENIIGSVPGVASQDQFHLDVHWVNTAISLFSSAAGWSQHISWFHPGMFGYQQNALRRINARLVAPSELSNARG
jgi:hypothetical protein